MMCASLNESGWVPCALMNAVKADPGICSRLLAVTDGLQARGTRANSPGKAIAHSGRSEAAALASAGRPIHRRAWHKVKAAILRASDHVHARPITLTDLANAVAADAGPPDL